LGLTTNTPAANVLQWVALGGSLCLLLAACVSLFKPRAAAQTALIACLLIWAFYAPATVNAIKAKQFQRRTPVEHSIPEK